jgi:hypothetical protein
MLEFRTLPLPLLNQLLVKFTLTPHFTSFVYGTAVRGQTLVYKELQVHKEP